MLNSKAVGTDLLDERNEKVQKKETFFCLDLYSMGGDFHRLIYW